MAVKELKAIHCTRHPSGARSDEVQVAEDPLGAKGAPDTDITHLLISGVYTSSHVGVPSMVKANPEREHTNGVAKCGRQGSSSCRS